MALPYLSPFVDTPSVLVIFSIPVFAATAIKLSLTFNALRCFTD